MDTTLRKKCVCKSVANAVNPKFMVGVLMDVEKKYHFVHTDMPNVEDFCKRAANVNFLFYFNFALVWF